MSSKTETSASSSSASSPAGAERPSPVCVHFGTCGGCQTQDVPYEIQLARKAARLEALLGPAGWDRPVPVHPSPAVWYYRNKMEFSFQDVYPRPEPGGDYILLGLKRRKRWDKVLNVTECRLLSPEAPALLAAVHAWALREGLEPYNLHRRTGFLRHLVLREGKATGDRMALLVTGPGDLPKESFVESVLSAYPATAVLWGVNGGASDVARSDAVEALFGPGFIMEEILGRRFRISPYSFFQTNTRGAGALYSRVRDWLREAGAEAVLDLYCGSGGISLCVADVCGRVRGVEESSSAVADARANASANGIGNAEFIKGRVEESPSVFSGADFKADAVVVDPPRAGLHPAAARSLLEARFPRVIYVSCNPAAMIQDMGRLSGGYALRRVEAVDLFPHTEHVETLALLERT